MAVRGDDAAPEIALKAVVLEVLTGLHNYRLLLGSADMWLLEKKEEGGNDAVSSAQPFTLPS